MSSTASDNEDNFQGEIETNFLPKEWEESTPAAAPPVKLARAEDKAAQRLAALAAAKNIAEEVRRKDPSLSSKQITSRDDPNYLNSFFKASRLHFIGMWKERFQQILDTLPPPVPLPRLAHDSDERLILHVDMDCFFCSVGCLGRPELQNQPVAVTWGDSSKKSAAALQGEISSANYMARTAGIRAGMPLFAALELCPSLITIPYEFDKYSSVAETMYRTLFSITPHVEGVSCDEAFADVSAVQGTPESIMTMVRNSIKAATGCNVSVGASANRLLARMATAKAKPDGQLHIMGSDAEEFLKGKPVSALPSVGPSKVDRLASMGITTVDELRAKARAALQHEFGDKVGGMLYNYARGVDNRPWQARPQRKSVSAQAAWGVRFKEHSEVLAFCNEMSSQVAQRMADAHVKGRTIQVTLKRAIKNAPDSMRKGELGCGLCDDLTRSETVSDFTADALEISRIVRELVTNLGVAADDVRGLAVQVSRLDSDAASLGARASRKLPAKAYEQTVYDPNKQWVWGSGYVEPRDSPKKGKASVQYFMKKRKAESDGSEQDKILQDKDAQDSVHRQGKRVHTQAHDVHTEVKGRIMTHGERMSPAKGQARNTLQTWMNQRDDESIVAGDVQGKLSMGVCHSLSGQDVCDQIDTCMREAIHERIIKRGATDWSKAEEALRKGLGGLMQGEGTRDSDIDKVMGHCLKLALADELAHAGSGAWGECVKRVLQEFQA